VTSPAPRGRAWFVTILIVVVGAIVVAVTRWRPVVDAVRSPRWVLGGRIVLVSAVVLSMPEALGGVVDIAGR
jgi:hypothetical protein